MANQKVDFLVIGGGVIGINMAINLKRQYTDASVAIIEKEKDCGIHASGRNSGVLHAGFYYTADSLKAKFTVDGNRALTEYCLDRDLLINRCGKLVVAKNESELDTLSELLKRGKVNGVELQEISEQEAKEIEPRVLTTQKALFSPTTASVDPVQVVSAMLDDAVALGIKIHTDTRYTGRTKGGVQTSKGAISAGYIINCAGLYADKIAKEYGFSQNHRIIPFKGLYLVADKKLEPFKTNIYPVPDLRNPFLGVHFTVTAKGKTKIGPTAIPAFWREHYKGFQNINISEIVEIAGQELGLFMRNDFDFRRLAMEELFKYYKPHMVKLATELATGIDRSTFQQRGPAGIRAQLYDIKQHKLEMDFHYEGDDRSFHVLNAVSPAFTCSISFTKFLISKITQLVRSE